MSPDPYISSHMYLRLLCKIHVSGFMSQHPYVSQEPLQDPCLRIRKQASICISGSSARSMSPIRIWASICISGSSDLWIHVSASICISGTSARSMSPDPYIYIYIYISLSGASARSMWPIHVVASLSSDFVALHRRNANFDLRRCVLCGPAQGKQSGRDPRERFAQAKRKFWPPETRFVWPCAGKTVRLSVSRRRNANFDLPRRIFCGPAQAKRKFDLPRRVLCPYHVDARGVTTRWTKIATALQRDAKKKSAPPFRAGETQILTSGVAFFVALRSEKRADRKFAPRPKRLYPYRRNPSVCHTVWGKKNWTNDQKLELWIQIEKPWKSY